MIHTHDCTRSSPVVTCSPLISNPSNQPITCLRLQCPGINVCNVRCAVLSCVCALHPCVRLPMSCTPVSWRGKQNVESKKKGKSNSCKLELRRISAHCSLFLYPRSRSRLNFFVFSIRFAFRISRFPSVQRPALPIMYTSKQ